MPGLSRKVQHSSPVSTPVSTSSSSSISSSSTPDGRSASIWSRSNRDDVTFAQLQKFWDGLSTDDRRKLLRIDKQALFEQVRKNLYCSRCHGLLVEGFSQIVTYGKSLYAAVRGNAKCRKVLSDNESLQDDAGDPSLHPWCGLATTRDSMLTVLDCFLERTPLEVLQNVFQSARSKERERELMYPDACGGNGRGWISQSSASYSSGRGHGMKETCALHTSRLSCEALVDFWSALSEETRRSLLRMKEEDFIERLMFRFDSKRFCRDCRRNVLREFKEMKELKRARKEPRCTRWFCAPDTRFQYEVSNSSVRADWHDSFAGEVGTVYKCFEWALGTGEGKADIFGFEGVGLAENAELEGLELAAVQDCFITIRAWRKDGRSTDICVKAHGLKGELCVHRRLFVGDGYVSITEGQSIQSFFEHAEETEEEEDEEALEKDGSEIEGDSSSRSQKHAKSPELARDFLLDAATVIFKEQVEKAFREGTARQNAHSIFVSLALGLLEDRVRVACKEIATLEKQNKLLEEEEHEKREEEERRERRKLKEKEKKLRRKEKLKTKEREKDNKTRATVNRHWTAQEKTSQGDKGNGEEQVVPASNITEVRAAPVEPRNLVEMEHSQPCSRKDTSTARDHSEPCSRQDVRDPSEPGPADSIGPWSGEDGATTRDPLQPCSREDVATAGDHGGFVVQQVKSAKRRSHVKRQQALHSHRGRQDPQQCACTAMWMKGSKDTGKSARNSSVEDSSTKQHHRTGASGNAEQTSDSCELIPDGRVLRSRMVCEGGMSYTKVVTRSWTQDQADDSSLQNDFGAHEEFCGNGGSLHLEAGGDAVSEPAVAEHSGIGEVEQELSGAQPEQQPQVEVEPQQLGSEEQPVLYQRAEEQSAGDELAEEQPAGDQPVDEQPAGDQPQATAMGEDSHSTTGSCKAGQELEADSPGSPDKPDWLTPQMQHELLAAQVAVGPSNLSPTQTPEAARSGYGSFPTSSVPGPAAPKGHNYSMVEMLPTAQVRHPFPMVQHHHRPPPVASHHHPQAGYGCFTVWPGPPPPPPPPPHHVPHHHLPPHHSARGNFLPAVSAHGGPRGFIMPGPPPPVYGYPRYPVPARMVHRPPPPMAVSSRQFLREVVSRPPPPLAGPPGAGLALPWVRPSPAGSIRPGLSGELASGLGQYEKLPPSSDFSLFHFGDPATAAAAATGFVPPTPISTMGNGPVAGSGSGAAVAFYESGSPTTTSSTTTDSSVDGDSLELVDDVVEVSSKCMGPLASGIDNKARMMAAAGGEYSLFAGASGKGFRFF